MVEASTSEPKSKGKGKKKKKKKDFTKQDGKQIALGVANKGKKKDYVKIGRAHVWTPVTTRIIQGIQT